VPKAIVMVFPTIATPGPLGETTTLEIFRKLGMTSVTSTLWAFAVPSLPYSCRSAGERFTVFHQ